MNWDDVKVEGGSKPDFSPLELQQLEDAKQHLSRFFGDDFPQAKVPHPFHAMLFNRAPWTRKEIIQFYRSLVLSSSFDNRDGLHKRLLDPNGFREAKSVLDCAVLFAEAGFSVDIEPSLETIGSTRLPDLKITAPVVKDSFFVEVSTVGESREELEARSKFDRITFKFFLQDKVLWRGRLHRIPSDKRMVEIEARLDQAIERCRLNQSMEIVSIPGILDVWLAPAGRESKLGDLAKSSGLDNGSFEGPSTDPRLVPRLKERVLEKARQLPEGEPGVIWIRLDQVLGFHLKPDELWETLSEFIQAFSHVVALVLTWKRFGFDETADPPNVLTKKNAGFMQDKFLVILNDYCEVKVTPAAIHRLSLVFKDAK